MPTEDYINHDFSKWPTDKSKYCECLLPYRQHVVNNLIVCVGCNKPIRPPLTNRMFAAVEESVHYARIYTSAIIYRDGKFLCLHHKKGNVWYFAGGKPQGKEKFEHCLIRECKEELGIDITRWHFYESYINTVDELEWVGLFFVVDEYTGVPIIQEPDKHDQLAWMSLQEMYTATCVNGPEMGIASFVEKVMWSGK